ncbi:MAG: hypothetical protein JW918_09185 [Anaerolineae bacterium]|nr:hypothetical protein [Anaerolineae bacterium]
MTKKRRYLSYLLRLWQTSDGNKQVWRVSLQSPSNQERRGFASLEELIDFLETQMGHSSPDEGGASVQ